MSKQSLFRRELYKNTLAIILAKVFFVAARFIFAAPVFFYTRARVYARERTLGTASLAFSLAMVATLLLGFAHPAASHATAADTLNFEARLQNSNGSVVADGTYNLEFKLYDASSGGTLLWTEDYLNSSSQGVSVTDGYLSVNLGSITGFPTTINWGEQLYLTMNVGGTASTASWDGEMAPRLPLTAIPYAFQAASAGQLQTASGSNTSTLSFTAPTATDSIVLPDASGTVCLDSSTACGFAAATGAGGYIQNSTSLQTNSNFFLQSASTTAVTAAIKALSGQSSSLISLQDSSGNVLASVGSTGNVLFQPSTDSSSALQIKNAGGNTVLGVDTTGGGNISLLGANNGETGAWQCQAASSADCGSQTPANANALPGTGDVCPTSASYDGYMYFACGQSVYYSKINTNGSTGSWSTVAGPTDPAGHIPLAETVEANGYLYMIGGYDSTTSTVTGGVYHAKINADGSLGTWVANSNSLPNTRENGSVVYGNGYIYYIGGDQSGSGSPVTTIYYAKVNADGSTGTWSTSATNMSIAVEYMSAAVANGYVYIFGGYTGSPDSDIQFAPINSDGSLGTWSCQGSDLCSGAAQVNTKGLPQLSMGSEASAANGYIYVMSGNPEGAPYWTDVWYAKLNNDGTTGAWSTSANSLPASRSYGAGALVNNYLYILGGYDGSANKDTVFYAPLGRVSVGTSIDLVGGTAQTLTNVGSGGSLTAGNGMFVGTLQVAGEASFNNGISINGPSNFNGSVQFESTTDSTTAFQIQNSSNSPLFTADTTDMSATITGQASGWNTSLGAALYVGENSTTGRSINAAGTINASGADYAEWIPWSGAKPAQGSVVSYQGSEYVVSSPFQAGFVGNDQPSADSILVSFAGQVSVLVTGPVSAGDILVDNGDGTAKAVNPGSASVGELLSKIAIAQEASSDSGVKAIKASVGTTSSGVAAALQNQSATFANISVAGSANIGSLNVSGPTTLSDLKVTGSLLVHNTGTAAFQVQDGAGNPMFNVNTLDGTIQVGSAAPNNNGILLRLNNFNNVAEPAEADGAMYYNSALGSFRCGAAGVWTDCGGFTASLASASSAGSNSNSENAFTTSAASDQSFVIPANFCQPGRVITIRGTGYYSTGTASTGVTFRVRLDSPTGTLLGATQTSTNTSSAVNNQAFNFSLPVACQTAGTSGTVDAEGWGTVATSGNTGITQGPMWASGSNAPSDINVDTTAPHAIVVTVQFGASNAKNTATLRQFTITSTGP